MDRVMAGDVVYVDDADSGVDDDVDDGANHLGHSTQDTSVGNSQAKELKLQVENQQALVCLRQNDEPNKSVGWCHKESRQPD